MKKDKIVIYFFASKEEKDINASETVLKYLKPFIRSTKTPIEFLSDHSIPAGADIGKYQEKLYAADLVFAFGSADLINDDDTYERFDKLIPLYNEKKIKMVAILVRNFIWDKPIFNDVPIFPTAKSPLLDESIWAEDKAFTVVAQELEEVITEYFLV